MRVEVPGLDLSESFLFLSAAFFAFLRRFSSPEFEAMSSDSYSWTTSQRSVLRSAIFINFYLFRMICCASWDKLCTWVGSSALVFIRERRLSSLAFTSNCFLLPLNLNSEADLSIFDWSSISFPWASSYVLRYPLNKEKTSSTGAELWSWGFSGVSFSFLLSTLDSESDITASKTKGKHVGNWSARERKKHLVLVNIW